MTTGQPNRPEDPDAHGPSSEPDAERPTESDANSGSSQQPDPGGAGPSDDRRDRPGMTGMNPDTAARPSGAALGPPGRPAPPLPPRRTGVFISPDDLREHVGALLRAMLGGYEVDAFGNFTFVHEGARIFVTVGASPFGPHVGVLSVTNLDLDLSAELGAFLLTTNHQLGYGAFSYDPANRAVWLRYTLLGTTIEAPELQAALAAISTTAASLDDRIQRQFGGRRFQDAPSEMQQRMEPPHPSDQAPAPNASGYL